MKKITIIKPKILSLSILYAILLLSATGSVFAANTHTPEIGQIYDYPEGQFDPISVYSLEPTSSDCLVPCNEIVRGQVKDGIPSIDNPKFINANEPGTPWEKEIVLGVVIDGEARAYPYNILNWHEIVNDVFNGVRYVITLCPLTGSGILYKASVFGNSELGTSGFLYENNLVFYDRNTDSYWSQMRNQAIKGEKIGQNITYSAAVETTWGAWKQMYPNTLVLSDDTGFERDYERYPYGSYRSDTSIYFPSSFNPNVEPYNLYQEKTITQILEFGEEVLLIPFPELENIKVLNHEFAGNDLVTFYIAEERLAITYSAIVDNNKLTFELVENTSLDDSLTLGMPVFMDNTKTIWNVNGLAIDGLNKGNQLSITPTYNAFWFAASTFNYDAKILKIRVDTAVNETTISEPIVEYTSFTDVTPTVQGTKSLNFPTITNSMIILLFVVGWRIKKKRLK